MSADLDAARRRLARAQHDLLSALVEGTPPPPGFDPDRLAVQRDVLLTKRLRVVAKVAPELTGVLGGRYRPLFLAYAAGRPMEHGYRRDARDFARHLLRTAAVSGEQARRLAEWAAASDGKSAGAGPLRRLTAALSVRRTTRRPKGGDR